MAHWYDDDGVLHAYVPYKDKKRIGQYKEATLREARPNFWLPSVTTKLGILSKPMLTDWRVKKAVEEAVMSPERMGEYHEDRVKRIVHDSEEYVRWAADFGTKVHAYLSAIYSGTTPEYELDELDQVLASQGEILNDVQVAQCAEATYAYMMHNGFECIESERTFVNLSLGYAGTIDFIGTHYGEPCIVDFKTQDIAEGEKPNFYEEFPLQLGAYAMGIGRPDLHRISVVTSRTNPGVIGIKEYPRLVVPERSSLELVMDDYFAYTALSPNSDKAFLALCEMWRYLRNYDCRVRDIVVIEEQMQGELEIEL